ncbi:hypothetical protein GUJ93_ZPchr0009g483 [Zizania palustris]|uniref:Uncharacterized protein n=1 Tax=Zizania palustris TaxID=103762 RepID=A0A8J5VNF9_ZIZPA|nr:hypothetical protein GUJ93_ZPchr0009g483 [Zizania palustris]
MLGVYDALLAAIVQKTSFTASFISRYTIFVSLLGNPDDSSLSDTRAIIDITSTVLVLTIGFSLTSPCNDNLGHLHRPVSHMGSIAIHDLHLSVIGVSQLLSSSLGHITFPLVHTLQHTSTIIEPCLRDLLDMRTTSQCTAIVSTLTMDSPSP